MTIALTSRSSDVAAGWILAIAQRGDRDSFISLFTYYAPRVKATLLRRGLRDTLAEELTQEAFLSVWRKATQFDPARASAAAWIYTIARNLMIDSVRRDRHFDHARIEEPLGLPGTPEDQLGSAQEGDRLHRAIEALPSEQSEVVRLSFFDEQTHAEIAEGLGLPLGTVKSRIRLATAHLRRAMEDFAH